jgi:hypothetical protein
MFHGSFGGVNVQNVEWQSPGSVHGMGGLGGWLDDFFAGVSDNAKKGLATIQEAAGSELTQAGLKAVIEAMRPIAAKSLGKDPAATTDEEVLAYISKVGTAGIADKVAEAVKDKADTAIFVVGAGLGLVALALYLSRRKG